MKGQLTGANKWMERIADISRPLLVSRVSAYRGLVRPHRPQPRLFEPCFRQRTRPIGRMERRCMPSFLNAHGFDPRARSEEHTSELQSLMRISYAVFCLKKKTQTKPIAHILRH